MSHTPLTAETLRAQAKLGGEELKAYILGDGTLDRKKKVERANEALALLRKEMQADPAERKKAVVEATRLILQDSLQEIRAELSSANVDAKPTLEAELQTVGRSKDEVLVEERSMATTREYVAAEGREALEDLKSGGAKEWLTYGAVTAAAAAAGAWLWKNTVGRVLRWFRSDPNKPTWTERIGSFFGIAGGGLLGILGVRWFKTDAPAALANAAENQAKQFVADAGKALDDAADVAKTTVANAGEAVMASPVGSVLRATSDATGGAVGEAVNTVSATGNVLGEDVSLAARITTKAAENPKQAVMMAVTEGVPLAFENGMMVAWIMGRGIALPGVSLAKTIEWISTGEQPDDYWVVWGQAGVAYILGKSAFNLFLYGKLDLPNFRTRKGLMMTAARITGGPIEAGIDTVYNGARLLTQGGRRTLRIKFVSQSLPARAAAWFSTPRLDTPEHIDEAINEWVSYESDAAFMHQYSQGKFPAFNPKEARDATVHVQERLAQIKKALARMGAKPGESQAFRELRLAARTTSDADTADFRRALTRYQAAVENAAADAARSASENTPSGENTASGNDVAGNTAHVEAPVVPIRPTDGPQRVQPPRVQPAPVLPATSEPEPIVADEELTLEAPIARPAVELPPMSVDPNAELELTPADTDVEYRLADETEYQLAPEPVAPEPSVEPAVPESIRRRMNRFPDTDEELGASSVVPPPRTSPGGNSAPLPRFEIPEGDLERRVEAARSKESAPDDALLDLAGAGEEYVDTTAVRPSAIDAAAIHEVDAAVDAAVKGDADANVNVKKFNGRR